MIDKNFLKKDSINASNRLKLKGFNLDVKKFDNIEIKRKKVQLDLQSLQNQRNVISKEIGIAKANKESSADLLSKVEKINTSINELSKTNDTILKEQADFLNVIPNIPCENAPIGFSEKENVILESCNTKPTFDFAPKNHFEIESIKSSLMLKEAANLSGSRFMVLANNLARLHRSLSQFMIDFHTQKNDYTEYYLPVIVNDKSLFNTGQLPKFENDLFKVNENSYLIPTAEVPLTNLLSGRKYNESELPLKLVSNTNCFRSEAGAYGKDTSGILRQHQFEKTELVWITTPKNSELHHKKLLEDAKAILNALNLHYRVVDLCTSDIGFSASRTFDLEVWLPGQDTYREISSCSNCKDFQSRRMNFKYKTKDNKSELVHTLNGSGLAVGRTLIAVLENYQQKDGSVVIPQCLKKYMGDIDVLR